MLSAAFVAFMLLAHPNICAYHVVGDLFRHRGTIAACFGDVLPNLVRCEYNAIVVSLRVFVVHVDVGDMAGKFLVGIARRGVKHQK